MTDAENCHRCRGSGSGLYNALSPESTCEVCRGTGLADPAKAPSPAPSPAPGARP